MAKRGRKKTQRKSKKSKSVNLVSLAESLLVGNIVTSGMFNNDMWNFFTAGTALNRSATVGADGTSKLTMMELIRWDGGRGNVGASFEAEFGNSRGAVVMQNLRNNGINMVLGLIITKAGSKMLKKQLRPTFNQINKGLEMGGVSDMVRV